MTKRLAGKKVALIAGQNVEHSYLEKPLKELTNLGAQVRIISAAPNQQISTSKKETYPVQDVVQAASHEDYHGVVVAGGEGIHEDQKILEFLRKADASAKMVAATRHGVQALIAAKVLKSRKVTTAPQQMEQLATAGATWIDKDVVVDEHIITSRLGDSQPAFMYEVIEALDA